MVMSKEEKIRRALKNNPNRTDATIAKNIGKGCHAADVKRLRTDHKPKPAPVKKIGISRAEFFAEYDPTTKVRRQLKDAVKMIKSGTVYKDYELRREVGCSDARLWREIAKDPSEGFADLQFVIKGEGAYWSDPATVREILETVTKAKAVT